ncbi:MAG: ABC transporter substrate-binding protein [Caldilineaceae bacterium]
MKRFFSALFVLLLLTGCGAPAAAPADAGSSSGDAAAAASAAPESILRVSFSWPTFIDPAVGNDFSSSTSLANIYDSLVFPNADGSVSPWLATGWEASADGLTWTVTLRDDVTFHDGSAMTASDVVYSFNRLKAIGEGYAYIFENVSSAEAIDDTTVQFTLSEPSGLFVPGLVRLYVLSEAIVTTNTAADGPYGDNGDYGKEWLLTHDAGTGPYMVDDFQLEEYLHMVKYDGWWGEFVANAPQEMRFIATTETATVRTLMSDGELEISDQWQTKEALQALEQLDGIAVAALPTFSEFYYMINTKIAPTDDIHCRRAMAYGFDYAQAVALEWPGTQQSRGPAPMALGGHKDDVLTFTRDVDKAKEELAQCQYAADIENNPVQIHWISEVPDEEKFALLFQANMAEIGLPVEIVSTPWLSVVENASALETSPHIVTIYVSSDLPEVGPMLKQRYHSSTAATWSQNEWLLDADLDARIDDALTTIDQTERFAKYEALQEEIAEMVPSLFLYDQVQKHAYQEYIDWPGARGETSALSGYQIYGAHIGIGK